MEMNLDTELEKIIAFESQKQNKIIVPSESILLSMLLQLLSININHTIFWPYYLNS
jgi:hypothetical protein